MPSAMINVRLAEGAVICTSGNVDVSSTHLLSKSEMIWKPPPICHSNSACITSSRILLGTVSAGRTANKIVGSRNIARTTASNEVCPCGIVEYFASGSSQKTRGKSCACCGVAPLTSRSCEQMVSGKPTVLNGRRMLHSSMGMDTLPSLGRSNWASKFMTAKRLRSELPTTQMIFPNGRTSRVPGFCLMLTTVNTEGFKRLTPSKTMLLRSPASV
mmetsp:Transcript_80127/g.258996  ORF Transcript_80127/g.258996 Transcript_80127/m.258996 type:complete len:215 (-) Transcript_80127:2379-3023(-)